MPAPFSFLNGKYWTSFALLFLIAVSIRTGLLFFAYSDRIESRGEIEQIAVTLATEGQFANAYQVATGPTAHNPPGLPFVFSLLFRIFGTGFAGFAAKCLFVICCYGTLFGLLPRIAVALALPFEAGLLAGLFGALVPVRRTSELHMAWEEPITAMFLALAAILTFRILQRGRFPLPAALAYGAVWGAAFHFAPSLAPVCITLLLIIGAALWSQNRARVLAPIGVALLAMGMVVLPWTIRNHEKLGSWFFMRSNFGLELRVSNNDLAGATAFDNNKIYGYFHPGFSADRAEELKRMGEVAYHRQMLQDARAWIEAHPGRFAGTTLKRMLFFWAGPPQTLSTSVLTVLYTLAAIFGVRLLWRRKHFHILWIFLGIWLSYPAIYYVMQINPRYRAPIDWTVMLSAAYAACHYLPARWRAKNAAEPALLAAEA